MRLYWLTLSPGRCLIAVSIMSLAICRNAIGASDVIDETEIGRISEWMNTGVKGQADVAVSPAEFSEKILRIQAGLGASDDSVAPVLSYDTSPLQFSEDDYHRPAKRFLKPIEPLSDHDNNVEFSRAWIGENTDDAGNLTVCGRNSVELAYTRSHLSRIRKKLERIIQTEHNLMIYRIGMIAMGKEKLLQEAEKEHPNLPEFSRMSVPSFDNDVYTGILVAFKDEELKKIYTALINEVNRDRAKIRDHMKTVKESLTTILNTAKIACSGKGSVPALSCPEHESPHYDWYYKTRERTSGDGS